MSLNADYLTLPADEIRRAGIALFVAAGVPEPDAALTVDVHVDSDLRGEESHGVRMLDIHLRRIEAGSVLRKAKVTILMDRAAVGLFDAHHSLGQVVAARAMRLAVDKAREFGVGIVGVRNANSFTSAKYYPMIAAEAGMIGITYTNSRPMMPPHGGAEARVGNNPMSVAAPTGQEPPFVLDLACTVAVEKIRQAAAEGKKIPGDWALGHDGHPTTDPVEALDKYVFLPFGGYKAFGIGVANEVLTSVLMGGGLFTAPGTGFRPFDNVYNCCQFFEAIDVSAFMSLEGFRARMDEMIRTIRRTPHRPGFEAIYLPGERGYLEASRRRIDGIPIHRSTIQAMVDWAETLGVQPLDLSQSR